MVAHAPAGPHGAAHQAVEHAVGQGIRAAHAACGQYVRVEVLHGHHHAIPPEKAADGRAQHRHRRRGGDQDGLVLSYPQDAMDQQAHFKGQQVEQLAQEGPLGKGGVPQPAHMHAAHLLPAGRLFLHAGIIGGSRRHGHIPAVRGHVFGNGAEYLARGSHLGRILLIDDGKRSHRMFRTRSSRAPGPFARQFPRQTRSRLRGRRAPSARRCRKRR